MPANPQEGNSQCPVPEYPGSGNNADYSGMYAQQSQQACSYSPSPDYIIDQLFTYHPATPFTGPKFEAIREAAKYFAKVIVKNTPTGYDQITAIQKVREAVMTANAGISLGGLSL